MLINDFYEQKMKEMFLCAEQFENEKNLQKRQFLNDETWRLGTKLNYIAHACALYGNISVDQAKELVNKKSIMDMRLHGQNPWLFGLKHFIDSERK